MNKKVVTIQNVSFTYSGGLRFFRRSRQVEGIKDVSFDVFKGDSLGIVGVNGSGKSTLLRLLNGVLLPTSGTIDTFGLETTLLALNVGFDLMISGRHNAVTNGMLLGLSRDEIMAKIPDIFAYAEIENFIDEPIKNYSNGMRGRLGFSIAMHVKSDILLVDEILSVGDIGFREKSRKAMEEKLLSGDTVIFVSHSGQEVKKLCNRAIWIDAGRLVMGGDCSEVVDEYEKFAKSGVEQRLDKNRR